MGRRHSSHGAVAAAVGGRLAGAGRGRIAVGLWHSARRVDDVQSTGRSLTAPSLPERISATGTVDAGIAEVAASDNAFSLALFQAVRAARTCVCSPYSAATILTLHHGGRRGQTQEEMKRALRITLPYYKLHSAVNVLDQGLTAGGSSPAPTAYGRRPGASSSSPSPTWPGTITARLSTCTTWRATTPACARIINEWVSERTGGRITDLMDPGRQAGRPLLPDDAGATQCTSKPTGPTPSGPAPARRTGPSRCSAGTA